MPATLAFMLPAQILNTSAIAQQCKAAGDPMRLEILRALGTDSFGVLELTEIFGVKQSGMSHHLKVLAAAGLVTTRREGNSIFYRRAPISREDALGPLKQSLFTTLDSASAGEDTQQKIAKIYAERSTASRKFFVDNAEKFRVQQDLIANFQAYASGVEEFLDLCPIPNKQSALEVGPGTGEFLPSLSQRFANVLALDNSDAMLKIAKSLCEEQALNNVELKLGDTESLAGYPGQFDCAVINMVLHHAPSPLQIFKDVAANLKPNGALLISELSLHDQDWVREACGDLWLGFSPDELDTWAQNAGLINGQSSFIALRNGFQIQIKHYIQPGDHSHV